MANEFEECGELHPETGRTCRREASIDHPTHISGFPPEMLSWINEGFALPSSLRPGMRNPAERQILMTEIIKRAKKEERMGSGLSDPALNTVGALRRDPHDTEVDAAFAIVPASGSQRMRVLEAIVRQGEEGRTDDEIQTETGLSHQSESPRRWELVKGGWIEDSGLRRTTASGQPAIVWVLTAEGRIRLR